GRPGARGGDARPGRAAARRGLRRDRGRRRRARGSGRARGLLDGRPAPAAAACPGVRVLVVSGIWPPDVGGPASHGPEVAAFLAGRGHEVEAVITADRSPGPQPYPVRWVSRSLPPGLRHAAGVRLVAERARRADVVYATGMVGRSSLGSTLARTPLVVKLTADPAYERARRWGLWRGSLEDFQHAPSRQAAPL